MRSQEAPANGEMSEGSLGASLYPSPITRRKHMFGKRGVIQTDATKRNAETSFRDPG
jgi:hypothetical protein